VGLPLVVGCLLILLRGAIFIGITGQIWSSNAEFRYFAAEDAVGLTVLCFILLFLKVPKLPFLWTRALACFGLITATVANHRSQWVALAAGGGVLILGILMGRPFFGERKGNRLIFSSVLLLFVAALQSYIASNPLLSAITVRLYAITDPKRDADASWRQAIWHDRIQQVGNNWPWGRLLGDRRMTLFAGKWWAVPDHSAYVSMYEIGGVILCCLIGLFWIMALLEAVRFLRVARTPEEIWPPMVAMTIVACSLAFGSGYDFPVLAPTMSVLLLLHAQQRLRSRSLMRTNSRRIIGKAVRP
jgi:hypothetical protein